jgi:mRNA interferase YafQ
MKRVSQTTQFARDIKKLRKRGKDLAKLETIVRQLAAGTPLDSKHRDHPLAGEWKPSRDCHVEPDWILIYTADDQSLK